MINQIHLRISYLLLTVELSGNNTMVTINVGFYQEGNYLFLT